MESSGLVKADVPASGVTKPLLKEIALPSKRSESAGLIWGSVKALRGLRPWDSGERSSRSVVVRSSVGLTVSGPIPNRVSSGAIELDARNSLPVETASLRNVS